MPFSQRSEGTNSSSECRIHNASSGYSLGRKGHLVGHLVGQGFWDLNIGIRHELGAGAARKLKVLDAEP